MRAIHLKKYLWLFIATLFGIGAFGYVYRHELLFVATHYNSRLLITGLLAIGTDINTPVLNTTPLGLAVQDDNYELAKYLISCGADVTLQSEGKGTAIIHYTTNPVMLKLLIAHGANINSKRRGGATLLHRAALNSPALARELITLGADVNSTADNGMTPLFYTLMNPSLDHARLLIDLLVDSGASLCATDSDGNTVLHMAASGRQLVIENKEEKERHEQWYLKIVEKLLARDADVCVRNNADKTPADLATEFNYPTIRALLSTQ